MLGAVLGAVQRHGWVTYTIAALVVLTPSVMIAMDNGKSPFRRTFAAVAIAVASIEVLSLGMYSLGLNGPHVLAPVPMMVVWIVVLSGMFGAAGGVVPLCVRSLIGSRIG